MYKDGVYFGQLDPNWRENTQSVLDEQRQLMRDLQAESNRDSLPKEIAIFGGGALIILTALIIIKYKKK